MKKWLENYWYHYKWHTLAGIFVIFLLILGIKSFTDRRMPDLSIVYLSDTAMNESERESLTEHLASSDKIKDTNNDGEKRVYIENLVNNFDVDAPYVQGASEKLQTVFYAGDHTLMIVHEYALEDYPQFFADISHKAKKGDKTFTNPVENYISGISLEGNTLLKDMGIDTSNLYIAMRHIRENEIGKKKFEDSFKQGYRAMDIILEHNR